MTAIATGVFKKVALKRQAGLNQKAPAGAAGSARYMRRVTSTLDLAKATYGSNEILPSQQRRDVRHGVRSVTGSISGELSVGGYQEPFSSILRAEAAAGGTTGAVADLTIASAGAGTKSGTITRAGGSYLADGFKVGDVVRQAGPANANSNKNLLVTGLTALVMTVRTLDGSDLVAQAPAGGVTLAVAGKKISVPEAGHLRLYHTIEHFFSDIVDSEQFRDCVFTGATIQLPATGMATVEFPIMGLGMDTGNAEYFNAPAAAPVGNIHAAVNGAIIVNGVVVADVTGLTITIAGNHATPGGVVGSNEDPDVFPGVLEVTGQMTVLFRSGALRQLFLDETEFGVVGVLTGDNTPNAGFTAFNMSRVKYTGATKDDVATGITQTLPFQALENVAGGAGTINERTTITVQDSAFV